MKRLFNFFVVSISLFCISCGTYKDGSSVWQDGTWILPWALIIGAAIFAFFGYRSWKSGTKSGGSYANPTVTYSDKRLPVYKVPQFILAALLVIACIVVVIVQNADK